MKVLIVLTSHDTLGTTGLKTGFWLEEMAAPYYVFQEAGAEIVLTSPKGGQPPIDPKSNEADFQTDATRRFEADAQAMAALSNTIKLADIVPADYDLVFYPGGHGPLWDLTDDQHSLSLIEKTYAAGKPLALVCHASGLLQNAKDAQGAALVAGKKVTGFTNSEEAAVQLTDIVPYLVEDQLKAKGGVFSAGNDWESYVVQEGNLVTGQNPGSSAAAARLALKQLQA
jgi:putative intracellular protease/amidase